MSSYMTQSSVGETLASRAAVGVVEPLVSIPLARSAACVTPPAQFGRFAQAMGEVSAPGCVGGLPERLGLVSQSGRRAPTLSVMWDDPVAVARFLRDHMQPADLVELIVILAEAAADVARKRTTMH